MKKIYITEEAIPSIARKDVLPKFLYKMVKSHMTSLGDNAAFPNGGDFPFDYTVLKARYKEVLEEIDAMGLSDTNEGDLLNELGGMVKDCKEMEKPIKDSLEMICENAVNRLFAIPKGSVNLECKLVDKVKFVKSPRMTPEMDTETNYNFLDIADFESSNAAIGKRRLVNALIQGAAYMYANGEDFLGTYEDDINKINQDLMPLYKRIIAINDYLLFTKKEEMSDERPMQGSYVNVSLGSDGMRTTIKAQGVIFPLLLQETIKGFFELFASHGLPQDTKKAQYIIRKADFILAEPWDLRLGVGLWKALFGNISDTNVVPYMFVRLVTIPTEEFNGVCKEMFANTEKGKELLQTIHDDAMRDSDYQEFTNRINAKNADNALIADSYFTASELDGLELDDESNDENVIFES